MPLNTKEITFYIKDVPTWKVRDDNKLISKKFIFTNFTETIQFVNRVGELSEAEGHHPDFHIYYTEVVLDIWTHAVEGLSVNDFILAAKIDLIRN
jgi:4a-hydroxytetrahydrobiopterin dehydratase